MITANENIFVRDDNHNCKGAGRRYNCQNNKGSDSRGAIKKEKGAKIIG